MTMPDRQPSDRRTPDRPVDWTDMTDPAVTRALDRLMRDIGRMPATPKGPRTR